MVTKCYHFIWQCAGDVIYVHSFSTSLSVSFLSWLWIRNNCCTGQGGGPGLILFYSGGPNDSRKGIPQADVLVGIMSHSNKSFPNSIALQRIPDIQPWIKSVIYPQVQGFDMVLSSNICSDGSTCKCSFSLWATWLVVSLHSCLSEISF